VTNLGLAVQTVARRRMANVAGERLYGEYALVNLLQLIPSMRDYYRQKGYIH
jgi:hypothetical protein